MSPHVSRTLPPYSASDPTGAALRAATLSFAKNPPPPPPLNAAATRASSRIVEHSPGRDGSGNARPSMSRRGSKSSNSARERDSRRPPSASSHSSSTATAKIGTASLGTSPDMAEQNGDILPARGTVDTRRRLFQDVSGSHGESSTARPGIIKISPERSRASSPDQHKVDASSLDDMSSLKNLFENNSATRFPAELYQGDSYTALHAPKPTRPRGNTSLTAAVLATQRSPSSSNQNSRRNSPVRKAASVSARVSPSRKAPRRSSPDAVSNLLLPPLVSRRSSVISSATSRESLSTKLSSSPESRNSALTAATIATSKNNSSKLQPPKPPPPRSIRSKPSKASLYSAHSDGEYHSDGASVVSSRTASSRFGTARTSITLRSEDFPDSLPPFKSHAPKLPRRPSLGRLSHQNASVNTSPSAAMTAALLSASSARNTPQIPSHLRASLTGDSIRAASLAPSRVESPAPRKPPAPPPPPTRRNRRNSLPAPPKTALRETMRKPPKPPPKETSPARRKHQLIKHHPHKHSEGERRRWRHFVTEPERKRYEGLWAANKGLLLPRTPSTSSLSRKHTHGTHFFHEMQHEWSSTPTYTEPLQDCIDAIIARDIWARSRLGFEKLADVWDLVDRGEKGRLSRDEFVVGTWLVDQCLKGRKLPVRVEREVWESVRRLGIRTRVVGR